MTFREVDGQDVLVFKPDESGRMQMIIPYPFMTFQKVGLWQNSKVMLPVLGISLFVMLLTLILWFVAWLVRRHYDHQLHLTQGEWWLRIIVRAVFACILIFLASMVGLIVYSVENLDFLSDSATTWFRLVQVIGVIATIGTLAVLYNAVHAWMSGRYRIWGRLEATVFALACLGFLWFVFAGHLFNFSSSF
jgi:hypothetical protein